MRDINVELPLGLEDIKQEPRREPFHTERETTSNENAGEHPTPIIVHSSSDDDITDIVLSMDESWFGDETEQVFQNTVMANQYDVDVWILLIRNNLSSIWSELIWFRFRTKFSGSVMMKVYQN